MFKETNLRSLVKSLIWRTLGVLNSYLILHYCTVQSDMDKAIIMNLLGFFIFFFYERLWNLIDWGKKIIK